VRQGFYILFLFFISSFQNLNATEVPKSLKAVRTTEKPIVDGNIDNIFYLKSVKATDFTTLNPRPGLPSEFKTDVYVLYDDQYLYIAAKLFDKAPESMIKDLSPRDQLTNTDYFGVVLDPYQTGLTGFSFFVSAAGVQFDAKNELDDEDSSWNDVWKSAVELQDDGWSVEIAIPYAAIRFPVEEINNWNINFTRVNRRTREESFWNEIDPAENGFLSQMGKIEGIKDIDVPLRLSLTPYIATNLNTFVNSNGAQDFQSAFNGGLDLRYGINEAFTLDMVLIPDFSQVQSDVIELNLSPFEQQFQENRPFFTEGLELFQTANIFFTRRIGGQGHLENEVRSIGDFESFDNNPVNNLVNAAKVSGRTNSNTGIGVFNAVEAATNATYIDTLGNIQQVLVNPLTNYNVVVFEQALKNNSKIGLINTNVIRTGEYTDANVTGLDWNLRNKNQRYDFDGTYSVSQRFIRNQGLDLGYSINATAGKISGEWQYRGGATIESLNYNPNDLGFLFSANEKSFFGTVQYTKFKPKNEKIARISFTQWVSHESLYTPNAFTGVFTGSNFVLRLKTFDTFGLNMNVSPVGFRDYFEPRTSDFSAFLQRPRSIAFGGFISSDYRKPLAIDVRTNYRKYDLEGKYDYSLRVSPRIRLNSKIFIVPSINYTIQDVDRGFVFPIDYENIDGDVIIGLRDVRTVNNGLSGQYNLNNKMSVVVQADHFFRSVRYTGFGDLNGENGMLEESEYAGLDEEGNRINDINNNFFTINTVYTWRFAPGSDLVVSYNTTVSRNTEFTEYFLNVRELQDFYRIGGLNVKALYFFDVNKVRKALF
jgi:hypothetical protein